MRNFLFENFNCLIVRDFLWILNGAISLKTLWAFLLRLPNSKMTSTILNTSSYTDLERFIGDWTCIIQILE
jgi:hypothetical protein